MQSSARYTIGRPQVGKPRAMAFFKDSQGHTQEFAVLFVDLDRFKDINDAYGHMVGDQLLIAAANTIQSTLLKGDVLGRFGGDEFTILLRNSSTDRASTISERLLHAFQMPMVVGARQLQIMPSVGIAVYPDHGIVRADYFDRRMGHQYSVHTG